MTWLPILSISILLSAISSLLQRVLMKGEGKNTVAYSAFFQIFSTVLILVFALITGRLEFPSWDLIAENRLYIFILLSGILYSIGSASIFRSLQSTNASKFTILFSLSTPVTIITAGLLLGEGLTAVQTLGIALILLSIVILNSKSVKKLFVVTKGDVFAMIAAASFGLATVSDKYLINWFDFVPYLLIGFLLPGLIMIASKPKIVPEFKIFLKWDLFKRMVVFSVFYVATALTFYKALVLADNAALVSSVNRVSTILVVILAIIFLKERDNLGKKLLCGVLSFIGLLLLTV